MSKDFAPTTTGNFLRRRSREAAVLAAAAITAMGASACGSDDDPTASTCEIKTYTVGVDGDNLMQIAVSLLEDSGDTAISQREKDVQVANLQALNQLNGTGVSNGQELKGMVCYNWDPIVDPVE